MDRSSGEARGALLRGFLFSVVVPGTGGVLIPWVIASGSGAALASFAPLGVVVIAAGLALYLWCMWIFATVGRGTPGPWDAPRRLVAVGPYRWVRNPIYLAALLVVLGEALLFGSPPLLVYAGAMAICFHLFVIGYEEPTLRRSFPGTYPQYGRTVPRWIPRPPRGESA